MSAGTYTPEIGERTAALLSDFKLTTLASDLVPRLRSSGEEGALVLLRDVLELEAERRMERRVERLLRASKFPLQKALDRASVPKAVMRRVDELARGDFLSRAENVVVFGRPGSSDASAGLPPVDLARRRCFDRRRDDAGQLVVDHSRERLRQGL